MIMPGKKTAAPALLPADGKKTDRNPPPKTLPPWTGAALAVCGAAMMLFGIARGEMTVVWTKAVKICLECIGIG